MIDLFASFKDTILSLSAEELENPHACEKLTIDRATDSSRDVRMAYAPFDHVNLSARLVIVGLTPGRQQASNALKASRQALERGASPAEAAAHTKVFASFSGPMRANLVNMMDAVGLARWLGLASTGSLWTDRTELVHFTSAIRYPVFVGGKDWSGSNPNALRSSTMRTWLLEYTAKEFQTLPDALIVPLGPKVTEMVLFMASHGFMSTERLLTGLPHPSGANAERIAYFLGRKPKELLSPKTNAETLDTARESLLARVSAFG